MSAPVRFGTDGIRGRAGAWPLDGPGMRRIGRAVAEVARGTVLVGWDTRASSEGLKDALTEGLVAGGVEVGLCGVLPTPALSVAVPALGAARGVMITASHNPWFDNGVKVLGPDGAKEPDEQGLETALAADLADAPSPGTARLVEDPAGSWRRRLPRVDLRGLRVLLDCANGAASPHAPGVLEALGATVLRRATTPDGRNINDGCGALHPPQDLEGCDLAIALDGDGDRLTLVDAAAGALDGDDLLWMLAPADGPVVGTVMTNSGLERALGGRLVRAPVGDRHVADAIRRVGARVGAEPSGHVLFSDGLPSSCGLFTALRVLSGGWPLGPRLGWTRLPSARRDVRVSARRPLDTLRAPAEAEARGLRVLVRASGTEPVIRVLVEGPDAARWADAIALELTS